MSSLNASAYYQAHRTEIKQAFQSALGDAVAEEGPDPVWRIGQLLQQQRTQPRRSSTNHIWAVSHALDRFRQSIGGLSQPQRESMPPWDSKQWLDSLGLINVILKPLLAPLKEKEPSTAAELPFFHAIGQLQDHTDLLTILSSHNVLEEIAKVSSHDGIAPRSLTTANHQRGPSPCSRSDHAAVATPTGDVVLRQGAVGEQRSAGLLNARWRELEICRRPL